MENVITWNVRNWITVVLMAATGFAAVALIAQGYHQVTGNKVKAQLTGEGGQ